MIKLVSSIANTLSLFYSLQSILNALFPLGSFNGKIESYSKSLSMEESEKRAWLNKAMFFFNKMISARIIDWRLEPGRKESH